MPNIRTPFAMIAGLPSCLFFSCIFDRLDVFCVKIETVIGEESGGSELSEKG